ncbi:MAG: methyltransferase [Rikenellaceae bacterium]|nr:methyltransferase [Rikenellaceae bacterium]
MKVGTDGVLLGAWMRLSGTEERILDIGTGTGLLALMAAQRAPGARVSAVEIEPAAARQARLNFQASPWPERLSVHCLPIQEFAPPTGERFGHIVSNPPFFTRSLKAFQSARTTARHTDTLALDELLEAVRRLLSAEGRFSAIYPSQQALLFEETARRYGLYVHRKTAVRGNANGPLKRMLLEFSLRRAVPEENELIVELSRHRYSEQYIALTRDFYLNF